MRRIATSLAMAALLGLALTATADAAPSVSVSLNGGDVQGFIVLENPGGELNSVTEVDPDGTTPMQLVLQILDPNGEPVYQAFIPETVYFELNWTVPEGLEDGEYIFRAEYWSWENGLEATAEEDFLIGSTPGFCARKFLDENGNGELDEGEETFIAGVEICYEGPGGGDCKLTDEDGAACWFLLPTGQYTLCVNVDTLPEGFELTTPECYEFELNTGDNLGFLFGCWEPPVATQQQTWGSIKALYQ